MASRNHRAQSSHSITNRNVVARPNSSASTTSRQSYDHRELSAQYQPVQTQPTPAVAQYAQPQYAAGGQSYPIMHTGQQVSAQDPMAMDPIHQLAGYVGDSQNGLPLQRIDPNAHSYVPAAPQHQGYPVDQRQSFSATPVEVEEKKKKGSGSGSAQNDVELRELLRKNEHRKLSDIAAEVLILDRTSKGEKIKQLFAMMWLQQACKPAKTSVPRNRVFSKYAGRCTDHRVPPLNPASFGKLVRIIFPKIATRRLGVRGESKYHYVDLSLVDDEEEEARKNRRPSPRVAPPRERRQGSSGQRSPYTSAPRMATDRSAFPQDQELSFQTGAGYFPQNSSRGRLYADIYKPEIQHVGDKEFSLPHETHTAVAYEYELRFPTQELLDHVELEPLEIVMPDITPYLPGQTDPDNAEALVNLYKSHITSLVDAVRYCREKNFFRLFNSFHGTMTTPVQNLFKTPEISPWILECDWMMYQKMIRNVAQLTLQVAPAPVLKFLDNVSKMLHTHLKATLASAQVPLHVFEARLEPATVFAHLLRQMLRVNSTAHAAAVLLTVDENRDRMWADWEAFVNVKRILENELPHTCSHEDAYNIMTTEIRGIFVPLKSELWLSESFEGSTQPEFPVDALQETVIDRIAAFLTRLPARFPDLSARTLLHVVNGIGTAVLREITVENGPSFQGWWLTKVFVDEMAQWLASLGGFLSRSFKDPYDRESSNKSANNGAISASNGSQNNSRVGSEEDFGADASFMSTTGDHDATGPNPQGMYSSPVLILSRSHGLLFL